jgi:OOP family OmpA-OmpF porin
MLVAAACGGAQHVSAAGDGKGNVRHVTIQNGHMETVDPITFSHDSDVLKPGADVALDDVGATLRAMTQIKKIRIAGHCDDTGDPEYNRELSVRRAEAVKKYLIQHGGIEPSRLETQGHGRDAPVGDNTTEEGRAKNRRVELIIVE